jgi:hypothetical protein
MPTKKKEDTAARGPWWVTNPAGAQFATYRLADGLKVTDEDPFDRNGNLRRDIPSTGVPVNPAQPTTEGIVP